MLDEVADGEIALAARRWIGPFRDSFPDFRMEILDLVADGEKVAAHFRCSGTHLGEWMGHPPTGRRFQDIDEIYIFRVRDGKLTDATGVEDNVNRLRRLGLDCWHRKVIQELKVAIRSQSGARSYGNGRYQS